jgi:hypothetical protein
MIRRAFAVLFIIAALTHAAEPKSERSVLFIGNSMIGKTMQHLAAISKSTGQPWKITPVMKGGARLEKFRDDKEHDALGTIDRGGFTDVVFVQGTSYWFEGRVGDSLKREMKPAERLKTAEKTLVAAQEMHEHIARTGSRTVLYLGYPHMPAAERTAQDFAHLEAIHWTMKDRLDAVEVAGKKHPTLLVPVGVLWMRGAEKFGESVWYLNDRHGTELAYYANAVLFYACMSGKDPRQITYNGGMTSDQAKWIKEQAWELATSYKRP